MVGERAQLFSLELLHFTLDPYLIMLNVKQGNIKYNFCSLWYDSTRDWTPISQAIGKHANHYVNGLAEIYSAWKNINTLMGVHLWYNFKQSSYVHHLWQHIFGISYRWLKNINISMEVYLLEKQNWYYRDHLGKIPLIYWQGWKTGRDLKIIST